ncbi:MAG TPA: glycosyltransferase family 4 protein [Terriglobales bacterium]|nr:glycosyltransferase family 4 protein [Terriglobales bacterium]
MKRRLLILTEIIAPYRIPVFNALARHPEIDLCVVFLAETNPATRQWLIYTNEIRFAYNVLPSWRTHFRDHTILLNQNVSAALREVSPDVILCGGYNYLASWQAQRWAQENNVPFLLWCESTGADRRAEYPLVESLKRRFFSKCDGFVVPGTASCAYVSRMAGAGQQVFVAPNAVDNDLFAQGAALAGNNGARVRAKLGLPTRYFLYVGRLVRSKGVLDLMDAYASLSERLRSDVGLVIAGDGPLRAELESRGRLISPGAVHLRGFVHRDELASYYALADCLVFPTHSDPWGLVVNEAMACGLPIICSEVAGCAADLIAHGRTVAPKNVQQLMRAMRDLAEDSDLRQQMSAHNREVIARYSPAACAEGIARAASSVDCLKKIRIVSEGPRHINRAEVQ